MSFQPGQILDSKYRIIRELGSGAMGAVYEGENVLIKRRVAIKVLLPALAERQDVVGRFEREAQAAGRIGSEHIVEVLDLGSGPDGSFYMVMEYLEGETLGHRIKKRGRLDPRALAPIIQQLTMGLEMAHEARIIHRDLKPENIFLVRDHAGQKDFVKILDFGVSKFSPLSDDDAMSMTRTGTVVGTPFYMAPEQAKGARDIDSRSDIYSIGVIMFEAVTGQVPFHAGTFNELIFKIVLETPPPPEQFAPDLDSGFGRIIRRTMSREVTERYQNCRELRDALSLWLHTGRDTVKPASLEPPPLADADWDNEQTNIKASGTQIMEPAGSGTAILVEPEDDDDKRATVSRPPTKRPPPPPASVRAPQGGAPERTVPQPPATQAIPAFPPPPLPPRIPIAGGATPINRRPPVAPEEWQVAGLPKSRVGPVSIAIGAVVTLAAGAIAAVLLLGTGSSAAPAPTVASQPEKPPAERPDPAPAPRPAEVAKASASEAEVTHENPKPEPPQPEPKEQPKEEPAPRPASGPRPAPPPAPVPPPEPPDPPPVQPSSRPAPTPKGKPARPIATTL